MSYKNVREALSSLLSALAVYPPRDDFPLLSIIDIPPKRGVSTADFKPTGVTFRDVLDKDPTEFYTEKSSPQDRSLRQRGLWKASIALDILSGSINSELSSGAFEDLILSNEQSNALQGGKSVRFIHDQLCRRSALKKLMKTSVGTFVARETNFLLGIVVKTHTAKIELHASSNTVVGAGGTVTNGAVPVEAQVRVERGKAIESCGSGVVAIRCIYFGFKKDAQGEVIKVSKPLVQGNGHDSELQDARRYVRTSLFSAARCYRKKKDFWNVELLDDLPEEKMTDDDKKAKKNATSYLGETTLDDGILGIPGRDLTNSTIITDLNVIEESEFFDDLEWTSVKEDE